MTLMKYGVMGELAVADVEAESGIKINHLVSADCGYTLPDHETRTL